MASAATTESQGVPLSLYVQLVEGQRADIEVISRAAIRWSETIKEAAFLIDPFADVRVDLISGSEGSISLNSLIRSVRTFVNDPVKMKALGWGVALFFAYEFAGWPVGKAMDAAWEAIFESDKAEEARGLSHQERVEAEQIALRIVEARSARERASLIYVELLRDQRVTGVGVSFVPGQKPAVIVPRSEFVARSGAATEEIETIVRRTQRDQMTLTLLAPVLSDEDHKWKFRLGPATFWAIMDDPEFRARLRPGSNSAPRMVTGIRMTVEVETTQEQRDGAWVTLEHRITRVHDVAEPQEQSDWLTSSSDNDEPR